MKKQLMICLTACALLSACATTQASKEAMLRAEQDVRNAESSLSAAKNAGAETYAAVNISSARIVLQTAKGELGIKQYGKASFSAQSSMEFSRNAISESETAKKLGVEAKRKEEDESRRKAILEAQAKAKAESAAKKSKPAVKAKTVKPAAKSKATQPEPATQQKEEPKKKSWWSW